MVLVLPHIDISLHDVTNCFAGDASCPPRTTLLFQKKGLRNEKFISLHSCSAIDNDGTGLGK